MVQEKYDTWRLPCLLDGDRIAKGSASASIRLSPIDPAYGRVPTILLLARCNPRPPPTTELRADFLFLVSGTCFFLRRFTAGAECAALLHDDCPASRDFFLECIVPGFVVSAFSLGAPAR